MKHRFYNVLMVLIILAQMGVWLISPIFPDEVAFHFMSARYLQDSGIANKLFYICDENSRFTPVIFRLPAIFLSYTYSKLSYLELRVFPSLILMFLFVGALQACRRDKKTEVAFIILIGLIGVAGSGLLLARFEHWQILLVSTCVFINLHYRDGINNYKWTKAFFVMILLVISLYIHIQAVALIPLVFFTLIFLIGSRSKFFIITLICLFSYIFFQSIIFHKWDCLEYPGVQKSIEMMTFNKSEFSMHDFFPWIKSHIENFIVSFLYKNNYQINYIPSVDELMLPVKIINVLIKYFLYVNLTIFIFLFIKNLYILIINRSKLNNQNINILYILIAVPAIFIFLYDANQNFYRSHFINVLVCISIYIYIFNSNTSYKNKFIKIYLNYCLSIFLFSGALNYFLFFPKFISNFEGPSISVFAEWHDISLKVQDIALEAGINLSSGEIIVDDLTYDSLKSFPKVYPITYLDFTSRLAHLSIEESLKKVGAKSVIARCSYMESWGLAPQFKIDNICASKF